MIPPANRFYRQALARPHKVTSRVEVWRAGVQVAELAWAPRTSPAATAAGARVFFAGNVRATLGSRVTRTLDLSVPTDMYPWEPTDLLNPYGQEIRAFRGVEYGNGEPDEFPVFVGRIRSADLNDNDTRISCTDNAGVIVSAGLPAPLSASAGARVVDEVQRLILLANPAATFGTFDDIDDTVPSGLAYDGDLAAALDNLAKAANCFWYALADGRYVLRRIPWTVAPAGQPVPLVDGVGGLLLSASPNRSSEGLVNRITVVSDRPDGAAPIYATADDTDPTSPTWVGGPMGVQAAQLRVTGVANSAQAAAMARAAIARTRALVGSWSMTCVPDASLELGDPLAPTFRGHTSTQVAAGLSLQLHGGAMQIDGRGYTSAAVEVSTL